MPETDTTINNKEDKKRGLSKISEVLLVLLIAVGSGMLGGYAVKNNSDSNNNDQAVRQAVTNEGELITKIADEVGDSVVSVNVVSSGRQQTFFGSVPIERESAGTGFILNEDGVIITNRHVVPEQAENVTVTLSDGTELRDIEVIGRTSPSDPLDVAFLKIIDKKGKDLTPVKLGDSTKVEVGQKVVAIGNALGQFQNTVTMGIISGYGRSVQAQDESGVDTLQNLFQTDASINTGNSGGPLVNLSGEVIGINTAVAGNAENIGFAIPISDVQGVIKSVLNKGELLRPYLGIRYISLTDDIAYRLNLNTKRGAYIAPRESAQPSVIKDSPADKAGLKEKDIIVRVNDIDIDDKNSLASTLGRFSVGDKVTLTVVRDDETINIEATLEAAPKE